MSAIHYKFSSSNEYKNITFDGMSISLLDLKRAIMEKQKLKSTELDLHITNAQTLNVYKDESTLIPKNTAVLVRRIPLGPVRDSKVYIVKRNESSLSSTSSTTKVVQEPDPQPKLTFDELTKASNLAEANASEDDKIKAAILQSTNEYDPSNFYRPPKYGTYKYNASTPSTTATPSYVRCYRCNQHGHYSMHCPLPKGEMDKIKTVRLATGIPRSHMVEVSKEAKGAMLTSDGRYVVPVMDKKGYDIGKKERPPFVPEISKPVEEEEEDEPIPDELICLLCKDLLVDAVVIPCCGNSYCDDCIRNALLDSETHQCPTCHKENISPDSLIANKFLRQAVNKFKNDTGIAKKKSNAPVWPRPAPSDMPKAKPVAAPPTKVSYGPPQSRADNRLPSHLGAYVVKAKSEQIVSRPYTVAKQQIGGGSSPHDPNQPIRIKFAPSETSNDNSVDKVETTPQMPEPKDQSTPVDAQSLPSQTPRSDSYTFNSTPDTGEEKPKVLPIEPLPPGISPPTAKVVRPLIENTMKAEVPSSGQSALTGIHPLNQSHPAKSASPAPVLLEEPSVSDEPSSTNATQIENQQPPASTFEVTTTLTQSKPMDQASIPHDKGLAEPSTVKAVVSLANIDAPVQVNPPNSEGLGLLGTAPSVLSTLVVTDSKRQSANVSPALQPPINVPPPRLVKPRTVNIAVPPPPLIPPVLPPGLSGIPPPNIPTSGVNIFQHPPPPFPFNLLIPPPTSQPPPGFPPPPGFSIPPITSVPPPSLPLPPGTENKIGSISSHRRPRSPGRRRSLSRSPRRRQERGSRKSKLDIMSDEFAEKMSKKRSTDKRRNRRRSRSRSASYSSTSSYSSSSYLSTSTSYSSYTGSSWSSSSYTDSLSRSPSPRRRRKAKSKKGRGRRRSRSWSSPAKSKSKSRKRRSVTPKRYDSRHRRRSTSKDKRRNRGSFTPTPRDRRDRRHSPRRGARERSRTPPGVRSSRRDLGSQPHPAIPVINSSQSPAIPGLPTKEQADFERDQALFAHYRLTYERDWYERGIMPPPPYDRFIQPRFSRSPSPPGTGTRILPPPGSEASVREQWGGQNQLITPSGLNANELYELQTNILREEQYYDGVQARLRAMADASSEGQVPEEKRRRSPKRRYDDSRSGRRERDGGKGSRDRYSGGKHTDERRRRERDGGYRDDSRSRKENEGSSLIEGDATPVRDERPSPSVEEVMRKKTDEKAAPRRAGDNVKMGKMSTSRRNRSEKHLGRTDGHNNRSDSKGRAHKESDTKSKDAKFEDGSRRSKPEPKKDERRSDTKRSDRYREDGKSEKSTSEKRQHKKSHSSSKLESQSRKEGRKVEIKVKDRRDAKEKSILSKTIDRKEIVPSPRNEPVLQMEPKEQSEIRRNNEDKSPLPENTVAANVKDTKKEVRKESEPPTTTSEELQSINTNTETRQENAVDLEPKPMDKTMWRPLDDVPVGVMSPEARESMAKVTDEQTVTATPPSVPDVVPESGEASDIERPSTGDKSVDKNATDKTESIVQSKREKSSKRKGEKRHKTSESSKRRKRAERANDKKEEGGKKTVVDRKKPVIEYDGSAPPPTGDELIKITIPKSRWEESDEEQKPKAEEQEKEAKPVTKGRRIKIKRKPPTDGASDAVFTPSEENSPSHKLKDEDKKLLKNEPPSSEDADSTAKSDKVMDARVVITLRRNSKRDEETRSRKVSLEELPTKESEKDRDDKEPNDQSVLEMKGKSFKVTAMRSSRRESGDFIQDDVLDLSHPSGLSDPDSEVERLEAKKATKKKKKKKKRKHKNRRQSLEELADTTKEESEEMSPHPKRKFVLKNEYSDEEQYEDERYQGSWKRSRSDRKAEKRESRRSGNSSKRPHDSSRDLSERRERKRYRRERSESESDHRDDRARQKHRNGRHKQEKRRKHHRRHNSPGNYDSSSFEEDGIDYRRSRNSLS